MWHTQTAAVTGSGHARQGLPCQDRTGQLTEGGVTAIALADGGIVLDVSGPERAGMTVEDLIARFKAGTGHALDNDRMLLS